MMLISYLYRPLIQRLFPQEPFWVRWLVLTHLKDNAVECYYATTSSRQILTPTELTQELSFWLWPLDSEGQPLVQSNSGHIQVPRELDREALERLFNDIRVPLSQDLSQRKRYEAQLLLAIAAPLTVYLQQQGRLPVSYPALLADCGLAPIAGRLEQLQASLGTVEIRTYPGSPRIDIVSVGHPEFGQLTQQPMPPGCFSWWVTGMPQAFELQDFEVLQAPRAEPEVWWRLAPDSCGPEVSMQIVE